MALLFCLGHRFTSMLDALKPSLRRFLHIRPLVSIVVVAYRMQRELSRTLETLSAEYQRDVSGAVTVIVVDNGSDPRWVRLFVGTVVAFSHGGCACHWQCFSLSGRQPWR